MVQSNGAANADSSYPECRQCDDAIRDERVLNSYDWVLRAKQLRNASACFADQRQADLRCGSYWVMLDHFLRETRKKRLRMMYGAREIGGRGSLYMVEGYDRNITPVTSS